MTMKKKHLKKVKKAQQKRLAEKKHEIDFDTSAYVIYNRLEMTYPCLTFDIVTDSLGDPAERVKNFPISLTMIAGAQTPPHVDNNYIYVMRVDNICALKQEKEDLEEDDEEESEDEDDPKNQPKLNSLRVAHSGCVNRLRTTRFGGRTMTATWSDKGKVHIYDLTTPVTAVLDYKSSKTYIAQGLNTKPVFTFGGHLTEGYALDWSPHTAGTLASGDCKKNIHIWTMRSSNDWVIDQQPLIGHENSVEDLKWSPEEASILASCSVDKSIRMWDLREPVTSRCVHKLVDCHRSDVNVIDWNRKSKNLIVSGGDDGVVKIWDNRFIKKDEVHPVAQFDYHKKPITSVEWDPNDDTVIAITSEDDRLTLWDLAVEKDDEHDDANMDVEVKKEDTSSSESDSDDEDDEDTKGDDDVKVKTEEDMDEDDEEHQDNEDDDEEEEDEEEDEGVEYGKLDFKKIPEQMLFLHQGQTEIKEVHWHPQYKGLLISTALNGVNIFKTISA